MRRELPKVKCVDVEVSNPLETLRDLSGYAAIRAMVRVFGSPVGFIDLSVVGDRVPAGNLRRAIVETFSLQIIERFAAAALERRPLPQNGFSIEDLFETQHCSKNGSFPLVTVAVCTRNRCADLPICLKSLERIDYPNLELIVVDNAPPDDSTHHLVTEHFPSLRYVLEPRPGLDWARNRAMLESQGEIIAYTDDDVVVDADWVHALVERFHEGAAVVCVTGLVVPFELETEAQRLFERYGGFGRGFHRGWFRKPHSFSADDRGVGESTQRQTGDRAIQIRIRRRERRFPYFGAGAFGTGCNMAYRRSFLESLGGFDPALDVGTPTQGGGDLEMYFRVLREGYTLCYEPAAIVRHRHRRERDALKTQIRSNGVGLFSFFLRIAQKYPNERWRLARFAIWWMWFWNARRMLISIWQPGFFPLDLILAEFVSAFSAPWALRQSRKRVADIAGEFPNEPVLESTAGLKEAVAVPGYRIAQAVRTIDLAQPLRPITDVRAYPTVLVIVTAEGRLLGRFELQNDYEPCSALALREGIVKHCCLKLLQPDADSKGMLTFNMALAELMRKLDDGDEIAETEREKLPNDVAISVVVATCDRPDDLRICLRALKSQETSRRVQIIVVDNRPESGRTREVVAEFTDVCLIDERRPGVSYARNTGYSAATGEIILSTDDDVTVPPNWIESTLRPFARNDVMVVCGNVVPIQLETAAQHLYEVYGGLGRGDSATEADGCWFRKFRRRSVPVWQLGSTANIAFRTEVLRDPRVGLLEECLGCGMPSEGSEDNYFLYKVLKAEMKVVYEPTAYVYHRHRVEVKVLKKQLYGYSKGFVCFHLLQLTRHFDLRALPALFLILPKYFLNRAWHAMRGKTEYPLDLLFTELRGWIAGPLALWRSERRVRKFGRSAPMPPAPASQLLVEPLVGSPVSAGASNSTV